MKDNAGSRGSNIGHYPHQQPLKRLIFAGLQGFEQTYFMGRMGGFWALLSGSWSSKTILSNDL